MSCRCCGSIRKDSVLPSGTEEGQFLQFGSIWGPSSWTLPETVDAGETGEVLTTYNGETFEAPFPNSILYRNGANDVSATNIWLHQWVYASNAGASIGVAGYAAALLTGTLRYLRVFHGTVAFADLLTYTVVVEGVDSSLIVSLSGGVNGPASNLIDTVAVNAGDKISVRCDGATGTRSTRVGVNFLLTY
jgi:hypothetical protein